MFQEKKVVEKIKIYILSPTITPHPHPPRIVPFMRQSEKIWYSQTGYR